MFCLLSNGEIRVTVILPDSRDQKTRRAGELAFVLMPEKINLFMDIMIKGLVRRNFLALACIHEVKLLLPYAARVTLRKTGINQRLDDPGHAVIRKECWLPGGLVGKR